MSGPLAGVKVLELAQIMAGPTCGLMLADLGADVIKVERVPGGDDTRRMDRPSVNGESASFMAMNRNKRGIALNLKLPAAQEALRRMAAKADVVTENYRKGTMEKLGVGYQQLKALNPGLFVYHCATPSVPEHISAGMYGMILVEPEGGLPKVDKEFYVMQGDIYTKHKNGTKGHQPFDHDKLAAEMPDYYVFNGAVGALTKEHKMQTKVGETVRIYFGVGGPNKISSFHVIGEIFDRVYTEASTSAPRENVQTTTVPPGGAAIVEFKVDYPGKYVLVDHALSRAGKGLLGILEVSGAGDAAVYRDHGDSPKDPSMAH